MNTQSREWTASQRDAIETDHPNIVCAAGPGSGKSSTLVARIKRIIAGGEDPKRIAALSFTNAASRVLQEKLEDVEIGANCTLHSFALKCLKKHGAPFGYGARTAVIAADSAEDLMAAKAESLGCKTSIEKLLKQKAALGRPARGTRLTLDETVIATYFDELKEAAVVDYDILLQEFHEMLSSDEPNALSAQQSLSHEFAHLFVDEVQDSNPMQWAIYRALPIEFKFYVGTRNQNLYEWNGSRLLEMLDESKKPETLTITLQENFRSTSLICNTAQRLISHNKDRIDKETVSATNWVDGQIHSLPAYENEGEEVAVVARAIKELDGVEVAVLARTNAIADGFRKALPSMGVPVVEQKRYELPRDWPFARSLIELMIAPSNDALAYFYLVAQGLKKGLDNKQARAAAQKLRVDANRTGETINSAFLKLSPITRPESALAALTGAGCSRESQTLAAEKWRELPAGATMEDFTVALANVAERTSEANTDGVHVSTIHGAKGKEYDVVFLVGVEDEVYPGQDQKEGDKGIEAARRCLYVGITRARSELYFSHSKTRTMWKQVHERHPSRFLKEIQL